MQFIGGNIYTENEVDQELIDTIREKVLLHGSTKVFFNVTGRTCHLNLSNQLAKQLEDLDVQTSYNYGCRVAKKGWMDKVDGSYTVEELRDVARKLDISGYSKMSKYYLMVLINDSIAERNSKIA